MKSLVLLAALAIPLSGQAPFTLFYATDDIRELSASGAGGTASAPGNTAAVFHNDGFVMVAPDSSSSYFAYAAADHATWLAYFGDEDNDGDYTENITGDVSALWIPSSAPNPPTIFDVVMSFDVWIGGWGANGQSHTGTSFYPGDIVRLNRGGTWTSFMSRALLGNGLGLAAAQVKNVDALTVDETNGDLYLSFESSTTVNGVPLDDGGIIRLAAANHTTDAAGNVTSVVAGSVEIVITEAEVDGLAANAGLSSVGNAQGMMIDPNSGTFFATSTGLSMPNLVFTTFGQAATLLSTANGGSLWTYNGITFNTGTALGMSNTNFDGLNVGKLSALAFRPQPLAATPRHLDIGVPVSVTTPGSLTVDISGATPQGTMLLVASLAQATVNGGSTPRLAVSSAGPLGFLDVPGAWGELYHLDPLDPLFATFYMGAPILIDAQGYGSQTYAIPALPPGFAAVFQGLDIQSQSLTSPVIPVVL